MDPAMKPPGLLQGKYIFKKLPNGNLDKTKVICTLCNTELVYCRSSSSLKYHLKAKHPLANEEDAGPLTGDHWTSVNNDNYLGVTVHLIDASWELHSFALGRL